MKLPIFPVSAMIFPDGRLPLRVLEPRHLRILPLCQAHGFVVCIMNPIRQNQCYNVYPYATRVQVIDFETLPEGLLGITIEGIELIEILHITIESDEQRFAEVALRSNWKPKQITPKESILASKLYELFNDYPEYATLYPHPLWHDVSWLAQRWLEVLPIENEQKQRFASDTDCVAAVEFIVDLLNESA